MENINYRVCLGYTDFYFENAKEALCFAMTAKERFHPDHPDQELRVEITLMEKKCEQESEPEEADALPFE